MLARPAHPYTRALVAASPRLDGVGSVTIAERDTGAAPGACCACGFAARCPQVAALCLASRPALAALGDAADEPAAHRAACHLAGTAVATA